jgi:hypothetical protein
MRPILIHQTQSIYEYHLFSLLNPQIPLLAHPVNVQGDFFSYFFFKFILMYRDDGGIEPSTFRLTRQTPALGSSGGQHRIPEGSKGRRS